MALADLAAVSNITLTAPYSNQFTYTSWSEFLHYMPFRTPQWKECTLVWWSIQGGIDQSSLLLVYVNANQVDWVRNMFTVRITVTDADTPGITKWLREHTPRLWAAAETEKLTKG
jgi:hypothetical protein